MIKSLSIFAIYTSKYDRSIPALKVHCGCNIKNNHYNSNAGENVMVKKIKVRQKKSKLKFNWKTIVAIIGALIVVILILMFIGQAGLKSTR
jgi:hypothetical protein